MKKYPLSMPLIGLEEKKQVLEVLNSGSLSLGSKYLEFEKKFARKLGVKYACSVSSGTAGLHLAMIAAGIQDGDEVITSPFSFIASSNAIVYVGAKPVFSDVDPLTYNLDPDEIERRITKKTKAILVVHIFGQAADMAPIMKIARKHKLLIIEDACESIMATYHSKKVGTFGQSGVFAFYPNKQMTTGEGGMIVTNNKRVYSLCCSLRNQGRSENMNWLDHTYIGYNYRLDEMSAGVGIAQLARLDQLIEKRRTVASWYTQYLSAYPKLLQTPQIAAGNTHTWFVYVILLKGTVGKKRDIIIRSLHERGVATKSYLPSIHLFDVYKKKYSFSTGTFPVSENVSMRSLALPFYPQLTKKDVSIICRRLITTLKQYA